MLTCDIVLWTLLTHDTGDYYIQVCKPKTIIIDSERTLLNNHSTPTTHTNNTTLSVPNSV